MYYIASYIGYWLRSTYFPKALHFFPDPQYVRTYIQERFPAQTSRIHMYVLLTMRGLSARNTESICHGDVNNLSRKLGTNLSSPLALPDPESLIYEISRGALLFFLEKFKALTFQH